MNQKVLQRLIWKDARSIRALVIATPFAIFGFYVLVAVLGAMTGLPRSQQASFGYAIWFLMPMLIACGAPALLVGGEEESGSLAWLQTLPANWRLITASKLIVTVLSLILAWAAATVCFLPFLLAAARTGFGEVGAPGGMANQPWIHLGGAFAASIAVMLCSFTTAYLFRSPITALVATVPLFIASIWSVFAMAFFIVPQDQMYGTPDVVATRVYGAFALVIAVVLAVLLALSVLAAWRRLTKPRSSLSQRISGEYSSNAFRPPMSDPNMKQSVSVSASRPSQSSALLWQQFRQIRWHLGLLTLAGVIGAWMASSDRVGLFALGSMLTSVSLFIISSLTFYGDSVRSRHRFLFDRGISPKLIWITRVTPTLVATLVILSAAALSATYYYTVQTEGEFVLQWDSRVLIWIAIGFAVFAMSQSVSQWSPRPTLAFFAAPVLAHLIVFVMYQLFYLFPGAIGLLFVSSAVFLFATWRLMPKWLAGETGLPYVKPFVGYTCLAIVLPYLLVIGGRRITTPPIKTQWRAEMMAMELPDSNVSHGIHNRAFARRLETLATAQRVNPEGHQDRIAKELAAVNSIGEHTSLRELLQIATQVSDSNLDFHQDAASQNLAAYARPSVFPEGEQYKEARRSQLDAVRVCLKWSNLIRQQAVNGQANFRTLFGTAENADQIAARTLDAYVNAQGMTPELEELVRSMPSQELVQLSRHNSLIRDWKAFQSATVFYRFAGEHVQAPTKWWLQNERVRSSRYIDALCQQMLDHWDTGNDAPSEDLLNSVDAYARQAYLGYYGGTSNYFREIDLIGRLSLASENDRLMDGLRNRLPDSEKR